jgi:nitroreductase
MIEEDDIRSLFRAAGLAPSSFNNQPWVFLYATAKEPDLYRLFFDCLASANRIWAHTAPVLALVLVRKHYAHNNRENHTARFEAGIAVGNLLVQAMSAGIYVHPMGGFDKYAARANLNIPDDYDTITMMALGYPGDASLLPPELHERASTRTGRKPVDAFLFKGMFKAKENPDIT